VTPPRRPVVVGFTPASSPRILLEAASLARAYDVPLIVVFSDPSRFVEGRRADGSPIVVPVDSDTSESVGDAPAPQVAEVGARVRGIMTDSGVDDVAVEVRGLLGEPATTLAQLAVDIDARFVVVGARAHGWRASLHELVEGSVAVHLSLHQPATVVVVPAAPDTP